MRNVFYFREQTIFKSDMKVIFGFKILQSTCCEFSELIKKLRTF